MGTLIRVPLAAVNNAIRHMQMSWGGGLGEEAGGMFALPPFMGDRRGVPSVVGVREDPGHVEPVFGLGRPVVKPGDEMPRYLPAVNMHTHPADNVEFSAGWMAEMYHRGYTALGMIHSHPGGRRGPSDVDLQHFPSWMVTRCFIYFGDTSRLAQYDAQGTVSVVKTDEIWTEMKD